MVGLLRGGRARCGNQAAEEGRGRERLTEEMKTAMALHGTLRLNLGELKRPSPERRIVTQPD
jgi:hypothetical protein